MPKGASHSVSVLAGPPPPRAPAPASSRVALAGRDWPSMQSTLVATPELTAIAAVRIEAAPLANLKHWIGVYKRFRHLLMKDYYHLTAQPQDEADWDAGQFCDGTKEGIVLVFRFYGTTEREEIRMRSLDPESQYRVTNEKSGEAEEFSGEDLMSRGLQVELEANDARFFSYTAV